MMILASGSPRRQELLSMITTDFVVKVSDVDEDAITAESPSQLAQRLATAKCLAVAKDHREVMVLGCDTVVEYEGQVFGKPKDKEDARRMLEALSGAEHLVHTGICLSREGVTKCAVATSRVHFLPIDPDDLTAYLETAEPYDKAGAYAIQGHAGLWCDSIQGTYFNIMGLPVCQVAQLMKKF